MQHSKADAGVRMRFLSETPVAGSQAAAVEPMLEEAQVYLQRSSKTDS